MRTLRLLTLIGVAVLAGLFASVNTQPVSVNYLIGSGELRLAYLLLVVVAIGMLVGWLASLPRRWRSGRELRRLRAQHKRLEGELQALAPQVGAPPQL
ncbi:MAG: LapA family protein [Pseudomonadota bacterium]